MQKKMKNYLLILSILLFMSSQLTAQTGDAGQPGEFLRYGVGGRALGMGHAFTGMADDASTIYYNPAGLMNVPRKEFTSMYTNLFLDSRYTYAAIALPRTFVGPHNAVGVGWVNLGMTGFDQRSDNNISEGSFDFYQQAFLLSGAREFVSTWGVLNYGLNLKIINQAFPGYSSDTGNSGWGFGADLGATFRPINLPLFRWGVFDDFFTLSRIMPLQIGVSLQNVLPPRVGIGSGEKDPYPFILRFGASYSLLFGNWRANIVYDHERFKDRKAGNFMGAEALVPSPFQGFYPSLRLGYNSRTKAPSFGGGLKLDYLANAAIRIDFAYTLKPHSALDNDFRLFLTVDFGRHYDHAYFYDRAVRGETKRQQLAEHLQVITRYPNDNVPTSAELLATELDTTNAVHYLRLIGGLRLANTYYNKAVAELKQNRIAAAKSEAQKAIDEYNSAITTGREITETEYMNFAECLIIVEQYAKASDLYLPKVTTPSSRRHYLAGVCFRYQQKWSEAAKEFAAATEISPQDSKSMRALSFLGLGEARMQLAEYNKAISAFETVTRQYYANLHPDYPRYPAFPDDAGRNIHNIADDAQFWIGECYERIGDKNRARNAYAKIKRFYPFSTRLNAANDKVTTLLKE